jgi:hypothetical protein
MWSDSQSYDSQSDEIGKSFIMCAEPITESLDNTQDTFVYMVKSLPSMHPPFLGSEKIKKEKKETNPSIDDVYQSFD